MDTIQLGLWLIKYDAEATRRVYSQVAVGGAEECGCEPCLNFVAAREKVYPDEAKKIFNLFGIDYTKEAEVVHTYQIKPRLHYYTGWFHFVGTIEDVDEKYSSSQKNSETIIINENGIKLTDDFSYFLWEYNSSPCHKEFDNLQKVEFFFSTNVPWVIDAEEPN